MLKAITNERGGRGSGGFPLEIFKFPYGLHRTKEAISFNFKNKCIADILFINRTNFFDYDQLRVLNQRLQTPYIQLHLSPFLTYTSNLKTAVISISGTRVYDKREEFNFEIIKFSFSSAYGVYSSHVIFRSFQLQLLLRMCKTSSVSDKNYAMST